MPISEKAFARSRPGVFSSSRFSFPPRFRHRPDRRKAVYTIDPSTSLRFFFFAAFPPREGKAVIGCFSPIVSLHLLNALALLSDSLETSRISGADEPAFHPRGGRRAPRTISQDLEKACIPFLTCLLSPRERVGLMSPDVEKDPPFSSPAHEDVSRCLRLSFGPSLFSSTRSPSVPPFSLGGLSGRERGPGRPL